MYPINKNIKYLRKKDGLSQAEFADLLKVSRDNIASYERGSVPKWEVIQRIVNIFHVDFENLLGEDISKLQESESAIPEPIYRANESGMKKETQDIPLYDMEAAASIVQLFQDRRGNIINRLQIPNLPSSDGALFITGDSMYPLMKSGDIVIYKQVENSLQSIIWGNIYLLAAEIGGIVSTMVKYIKKSSMGNEYIQLVSYNEHHQPLDIHISKLRALAVINASIRYNTM